MNCVKPYRKMERKMERKKEKVSEQDIIRDANLMTDKEWRTLLSSPYIDRTEFIQLIRLKLRVKGSK